MTHIALLLKFGVNEVELHHQLATVTNTERESILTCVETVECSLSLGIVEESSCPSFSRAKNVRVRESTAEYDEINLVECLAAADKVGHCNVLNIEACKIHCVCHFALAVCSLLADDCCTNARFFAAVSINAIFRIHSCEACGEAELQRLVLVVLQSLVCTAVEALLAIHKVRAVEPYVAHIINIKETCAFAMSNSNLTFLRGGTYLHKANACLFEYILHFLFVGIGHLNNKTGILGEEELNNVSLGNAAEINLNTTLGVCEAHFEQCGNETSG